MLPGLPLFRTLPCLLLFAAASLAQTVQGTLTGVVRDPTRAVIAGAKLTVTNESTNISETVTSQADGAYLVPLLPAGYYRITVDTPGFKRVEINRLKIDVGSAATQDVTLELGQVSEKVEVNGESSLVNTASGQVSTTIQMSQVLEMPLVSRNIFSLTNLAVASRNDGGGLFLGGGHTRGVVALYDGINDTRGDAGLGNASTELTPPVDSVQEFTVAVVALSAEYGRTSSGVVSAVTKSGTNRFHGNFYEFVRNDEFDAAGWGNDSKPVLRQNNFGGTIGGPILKNRTFFFYNYDGTRIHNSTTFTRSVPLPEWRKGDFSHATRDAGGRAAPIVIYDPETGTGTFTDPRNTVPFANNVIPAGRLDPVAVKALGYVPAANRAPDNPFNQSGNWQQNLLGTSTSDYHIVRVDHNFTDMTRMYLRYVGGRPSMRSTVAADSYGAADPNATQNTNPRSHAAFNATHIFSPTLFLNFTTGVNRVLILTYAGGCCDTNYGKLLGIPNVPGEAFPRFTFGGGLLPLTQIGPSTNANRRGSFTNSDFDLMGTNVRSKQTLKFGIHSTRFNTNNTNRDGPSGVWAFQELYSRGVNANGAAIANTGTSMADFLLGRLNAVSASVNQGIGQRMQYYGGFFQDDWRVTTHLTLNLGIRYDVQSPLYEVANRMSNYDPYSPNPLAGAGDIPVGALGKTIFAGLNGYGRYLWNWDKNNVAPRFGFAFDPKGNGRTSIRGGFGIFYGDPYDTNITNFGSPGFVNSYNAGSPVAFRLREGVPPGALDNIPVSELVPSFGTRNTRFATANVSFVDQNHNTVYTENFNLTVQHQWQGMLFEAGYLGALGRHVPITGLNLNLMQPSMLSRTEIPERLRRPWTALSGDRPNVSAASINWGFSDYNALTLKFERRLRNGLGWMVAYTFTKWFDDVPYAQGNQGDKDGFQNLFDLRNERALSANSVPHRLVFSPMIDLPVGRGRRWMNRRGVLDAMFGGWQISGIGTLRSGAPFGVTVLNGPRDILGDQSYAALRPNLTGDPVSASQGQPATGGVRGIQWLNPSVFVQPARYTFGTASRTIPGALGPGLINFDTMLAKNFYMRERWRMQVRWETFDTSNTPQWGLPNDILGGSSFGTVTSASGSRVMQLGLKLYW